ncbi:MAG TPA: tetratricopeptide repeat protein [Oculatellaceae cyanobacterium]
MMQMKTEEDLETKEPLSAIESLVERAKNLQEQASDTYTSWRSRAETLVIAIAKLEKREIEPDSAITLFDVPLVEGDLRDAAEKALRLCAFFATSGDERIALIDEANSVRNTSWV